jgi:predicted metal-dependent enzyme (double-stranded beta helix superfamily)
MTSTRDPKIDLQRRAIVAGAAAVSSQLFSPLSALADSRRPKSTQSKMMDIDRFVADCIAANKEVDAQAAVNEVLSRAVSTPNAVLEALGDPGKAGLNVLLKSPALTIFAATWTPQMNLMPHDHLMWANIGIYTGREDNIFWKRTPDGIRAVGADALFVKDTAMLPEDALHSVTNV